MAITPRVVVQDKPRVGAAIEATATVTVGAADTYVAGGFAITPAAFGMTEFTYVQVESSSNGYKGVYVPATGKVKVFSAAGVELGTGAGTGADAATVLQSVTFLIRAVGQ